MLSTDSNAPNPLVLFHLEDFPASKVVTAVKILLVCAVSDNRLSIFGALESLPDFRSLACEVKGRVKNMERKILLYKWRN